MVAEDMKWIQTIEWITISTRMQHASMEAMQLIVLAISISHHDNPCAEL